LALRTLPAVVILAAIISINFPFKNLLKLEFRSDPLEHYPKVSEKFIEDRGFGP
jgi:hypothetical protein